MKTLVDQLANYAAYHRDPRNIATHFVGIPMIVVAITVLLSRPAVAVGGVPLSLAMGAALAATMYYLRMDVRLGLLMGLLLGLSVWFGAWAAALPTSTWLAVGAGGFIGGWIIQFIGHIWEGRKPAFVDDVMGLIIGPLFVVVEVLFLAGLLSALRHEIETRVGPVRRRVGPDAART